MKVLRFMLSAVVLMSLSSAMAISLSRAASAKSPGTRSDAEKSDAQKSFEQLKSLAGKWEGKLTTVPSMPEMEGATPEITMRVTSRGNALVHEMKGSGADDDPIKNDHPVTMLYLDGEKLYLTHYCDAGNRPRMVARTSADGKKIEFDFVDVAGGTQNGHMHHAVFTIIDADHHAEDWTFMMPGDKPMQAHMDLQRVK
ncbi:MAG TPA: hypothetical protein VGF20_08205 [Candidatus Acidoferrum sp.]